LICQSKKADKLCDISQLDFPTGPDAPSSRLRPPPPCPDPVDSTGITQERRGRTFGTGLAPAVQRVIVSTYSDLLSLKFELVCRPRTGWVAGAFR
jgi:hypothetical protein